MQRASALGEEPTALGSEEGAFDPDGLLDDALPRTMPPIRTDRSTSLRDVAGVLEEAGLLVETHNVEDDVEIRSLSHDSRDVDDAPSCLFFCVSDGSKSDGHAFVEDAASRGDVVAVVAERSVEVGAPVLVVNSSRKALGLVAQRFYDHPSSLMRTCAVTGTNGKTTTSWLVRGILEEANLVTGMIGTIEYALAEHRLDARGRIWEPYEDDPTLDMRHALPDRVVPYVGKYEIPNTTPDALAVQRILSAMYDQGAEAVVMEASSHALEQGRCDYLDVGIGKFHTPPPLMHTHTHTCAHTPLSLSLSLFSLFSATINLTNPNASFIFGDLHFTGIFTNLTQDHLDYHGDMGTYAEAKLKLFDRIPRKGEGGEGAAAGGTAVVNLDDPHAELFIARALERGVRVLTYTNDPSKAHPDLGYANVVCMRSELSLSQSDLVLGVRHGEDSEVPETQVALTSKLLGRANISNILAAFAAGLAMDVELESIVAGIEATEFVPGRCELISEGQDFSVIVDYAHTPDALARLLDDVRWMGAARVITVFGCGGDRDRSKRPLMGRIAHDKSDYVFVTSDNPRTENPHVIIDDIVAGFSADIYDRADLMSGEYLSARHYAGFHWLQESANVFPKFTPKATQVTHATDQTKYLGQWMQAERLQSGVRRVVMASRYYAIKLAIGVARPGDVVVIAGKGHEDYMQVMPDHFQSVLPGEILPRVDGRNVPDEAFVARLFDKETTSLDDMTVRSWFDDRVEAYYSIHQVRRLQDAGYDTWTLPWREGMPTEFIVVDGEDPAAGLLGEGEDDEEDLEDDDIIDESEAIISVGDLDAEDEDE